MKFSLNILFFVILFSSYAQASMGCKGSFKRTSKYHDEFKKRFLSEVNQIKAEYTRMEGLAEFSEKFFGRTRFSHISYTLSGISKGLDWTQFIEKTKNFNQIRMQIFEKLIEDSKKFTLSKLSKLTKFPKLPYRGTAQDLDRVIGFELNEQNERIKKYKKKEGLVQFAKEFVNGNILEAFDIMFNILPLEIFEELAWPASVEKVKGGNAILKELFNKKGEIKEKYKGQKGYREFTITISKTTSKKNMSTVFQIVATLLSKEDFKKLKNWQVFRGTVKEFDELREKFLDSKIIKKYKGMPGLAEFAEEFYGGDMRKACTNVSAALGGLKGLEWKIFRGTSDQYKMLLSDFKKEGLKGYKGEENQRRVAKLVFGNNLWHSYIVISHVRTEVFSDGDIFLKLGWDKNLK